MAKFGAYFLLCLELSCARLVGKRALPDLRGCWGGGMGFFLGRGWRGLATFVFSGFEVLAFELL